MTVKELIELSENGVLNIKYDERSKIAEIGKTALTVQQAYQLAIAVGWISFQLHPFEIISKTHKFSKSLKSVFKNCDRLYSANVELNNIASQTYGKTFDKVQILSTKTTDSYTIIYNMEGSGAPYVVYTAGKSLPLFKGRSLKQSLEFIRDYQ